MPRVNPCLLKRPGAVGEYREFTDPLQPGQVFGFALRVQPDGSLDDAIARKAEELVRDYVTGRNGGPRAPLPDIDGKPLAMTEGLCRNIAYLMLTEFVPDWNTIEDIRWKPQPPEPEIDPVTGKAREVDLPPLPPLEATGYDACYTFDQWRALRATTPNAWDELMEWGAELVARAKGHIKN